MDESKKSQKPEERPETVQPVQGTEKKKKKKKEKKPPSRLRVLLGRVIALVVTVFLVVGAGVSGRGSFFFIFYFWGRGG